MAYQKKTNEERKAQIENALKTVEQQVPKVFESDNFQEYLHTMSKFHKYSVGNQMLITTQKPEASIVAGFNAWKELGRTVNKGEKGIMILAPYESKYSKEVDKVDSNGNKVVNAQGETEKELKEFKYHNFRAVYVFDVSQTSGKELPEPVKVLNGNSKEARDLLEAIEISSSFPVEYHNKADDIELAKGAKGYFDKEKIVIDEALPMDQKAKTLVHEFAHSVLHNEPIDVLSLSPSEVRAIREQREIEAEAVAYAVSDYFGLDTSDYSFGYIASWSNGKDVKALKDILNNIQVATNDIVDKIEKTYELVKEKNKDLELPSEEVKEQETETIEDPVSEITENIQESSIDTPEVDQTENLPEDNSSSDTEEAKETNEEPEEKQEEVKEEPVATPTVPAPEEKKEKKSSIEDFGEKIGGARKDMWKTRGMNLDDLSYMNDAEKAKLVKKDNVWPKPDYQSLVDEGIPREVVYFYKVVRDACATKPEFHRGSNEEQLLKEYEQYVEFVSKLKNETMACKTYDDIAIMGSYFQDNDYVTRHGYGYVPTDKAPNYVTNKIFKAVQEGRNLIELRKDIRKSQFCYSEEEKILLNYNILRYIPSRTSFEKAEDGSTSVAVKLGYSTYYLNSIHPEFLKPENYKDDTFFVVSGRQILANNFDTEEMARKFCIIRGKTEQLLNQEQKSESETKRKTALKPPYLVNIKRTGGENYREGKNVSGQDYLDTFNFKGGEFGNWLNEKERQESLNQGYDALKDFAKALNISDQDVTLNGRLSIAFGARGKGAALAHYEPEREVINLTKMKGAGSLGHELIHFIDDVVGKKLGLESYLTQASYKDQAKVPESFKELLKTMKYAPMTPNEVLESRKQHREDQLENFRRSLNNITRKGDTPEKEAKRQELIEAVVQETREIKDYSNRSIGSTARTKVKVIEDKEMSPAFKSLHEHQVQEMSCRNCSNNVSWCNAQRAEFSRLNERLENIEPEDLKGTKETKFYRDAQFIDNTYSKSGKGYWASDVELLARAGAAYVKDRLEEQGIQNDYLCGHADQEPTHTSQGDYYTSPQGEERKLINQAFDKFFEEVKALGLFHEPEKEMASLDDKLMSAEEKMEKLAADIRDSISKTFEDVFKQQEAR